MMKAIKQVYFHIHKENMPIYYVQAPNLEKYTTTEKDASRGISRMPPANQRNYSEDLFDLSETKTSRRPTEKEIEQID